MSRWHLQPPACPEGLFSLWKLLYLTCRLDIFRCSYKTSDHIKCILSEPRIHIALIYSNINRGIQLIFIEQGLHLFLRRKVSLFIILALCVTPFSSGSSSCTCIGKNRAFQHSDGSCVCRTGFIFYNELDLKSSTSDSESDCQPEVSGRSRLRIFLTFQLSTFVPLFNHE